MHATFKTSCNILKTQKKKKWFFILWHFLCCSATIKHVASKLEAIADKLGRILFENAENLTDQRRVCEGKESVLSLYRYNHKSFLDQSQSTLHIEKERKLCDHSLSLHLPFKPCQIYVQSMGDDFYFDAGPQTLVVTIGKQHKVTWIMFFFILTLFFKMKMIK